MIYYYRISSNVAIDYNLQRIYIHTIQHMHDQSNERLPIMSS